MPAIGMAHKIRKLTVMSEPTRNGIRRFPEVKKPRISGPVTEDSRVPLVELDPEVVISVSSCMIGQGSAAAAQARIPPRGQKKTLTWQSISGQPLTVPLSILDDNELFGVVAL